MEDAFLICFFTGLFFTAVSALLAGIGGGHDGGAGGGHADAGDFDAGHAEMGDLDVGDLDLGEFEAGPDAHFEMGHDFDHSIADAGGDGHVEVGIGDSFPGLSAWSPTVISAFVSTFGGVGYLSLVEWQAGTPLSILAGLVGGIAFAFFVFWGMNKIFAAVQSSSDVQVSGLKGKPAEIITPIPEGGVGEISYVAGGTRLCAPARSVSGKAVPRGATVVIVRITPTIYYVKPL